MRSFRSKPVGWRGESYRHYLAAKGFSTVRDDRLGFPFIKISKNGNHKEYIAPDEQVGPTIHVETGKDPWVRVRIGDELEPVMSRPEEGFKPVTPETADKEKVRKAVLAMDRIPVKRSALSLLRDKVRVEDFRPVDKSKVEEILEKNKVLDEGQREMLKAFEPGTANVAVVEKQLEDQDAPRIERRPYATVLGKPVERIDTSDVTYRGPRLKIMAERLVGRRPEFTATVLAVPEKKDKRFKEQLEKESAFVERQKAIKELKQI